MSFFKSILAFATVFILPCTLALPNPNYNLDPGAFSPDFIIEKDVAIVGGGSTGTYAAIRLKDQGKSVVVIEKKARIGGHTETYIDPETNTPIDIGVKLFHDLEFVHAYFARFGLSLVPANISAQGRAVNVDLRTGKPVTGLPPVNETSQAAAFQRYAEQLAKYPDLNRGFYLPEPVPEDLLLPFGEFVAKYHLEEAAYYIFFITSAFGDVLEIPTVQVMRTFGFSLLTTTLLTTEHQNNSELYSKAQDELLAADALLLSSTVLATSRNDGQPVKLLVNTPEGPKLILAKKLLMTIPPQLDYLAPFDTSDEERNLFSQFTSVGYYTSILTNTGLPPDLSINNLGQDTPYGIPPMPGAFNIVPSANPNLTQVYYGTKVGQQMTDDEAKAEIIATIKRYQKENPDEAQETEPYFVEFSNHSPYNMMVDAEKTKAGFYKNLYGLQGKRNTFWTGASFRAHDSSMSWAYTDESVLPGLIAGLD